MHRYRRYFPGGMIASLALYVAGCNGGTHGDPRIAEIQRLEDQIAADGRLLATRDEQIADQAKIIDQLRGRDLAGRMAGLVRVDRIEIERLSGGYDENRDGRDEGVVVYLRLIDADGDVIKAAGSASLTAYDLSRPPGIQIIAEGQWSADEMKPFWYGKLMTSHYTLRAPFVDATVQSSSATVVVQFTELLTGRTFDAQSVVGLHVAKAEPDRP